MHFDRAITLYDPAAHRPLAALFGQDNKVAALTFRSLALWLLGYPDAALADAEHALKDAREIGQAGTLMYALTLPSWIPILCGKYAAANAHSDEAVALAEEKGTLMWKALGTVHAGLCIGSDQQSLGRSSNDQRRDHCMAINGINILDALVLIKSGREHTRSSAKLTKPGAILAKR